MKKENNTHNLLSESLAATHLDPHLPTQHTDFVVGDERASNEIKL